MPSDWANLPQNLLDSIVERFFSTSDFVRFSLVCLSWFGVAKHNQDRFSMKMLSHPEPPMLLFFNNNEAAWNLYNVVDNKVIDVQSKMPNRRFCGSSRGWLVHVEKDFTVTLTKPVFYKSNKRGKREDVVVRLPKLNPPNAEEIERDEYCVEKCEYYVIKATITADPVLDEDDYVVVLSYENRSELACIRPSKDTTWTYLSAYGVGIGVEDVLHIGGDKFYAVQSSGNLLTFSKFNSDVKYLHCELPENEFTVCTMKKYLLDDGKNLLMVDRYYDHEDDDGNKRFAMDFIVYEFDFDKCKWIEKKTLGEDVALFVGEIRLISVAASNFPGCKQDCIYYNHDVDHITVKQLLHDFGMYDLETKNISKPYSEHLLTLLSLTDQRPIWFMPSIHL